LGISEVTNLFVTFELGWIGGVVEYKSYLTRSITFVTAQDWLLTVRANWAGMSMQCESKLPRIDEYRLFKPSTAILIPHQKGAIFPAEMVYFPSGKAIIGPTAAASARNAWDGYA
jgi:hypothetical protein